MSHDDRSTEERPAPDTSHRDSVLRLLPGVRALLYALPVATGSCSLAWLQSARYEHHVMRDVEFFWWAWSTCVPWLIAGVVLNLFIVVGSPKVWPRGARIFVGVLLATILSFLWARGVVLVHDVLWGIGGA